MSEASPVILDTDVWSKLFAARRDVAPEVSTWRRLLTGRPVLIAAQTRGELEFGALKGGWGPDRVAAYRSILDRYPVLCPTREIIVAWAELRAECRQIGHSLHEKIHMGDAWVAATARALRIPLLSADGIYRDAPGVELLGEADGEP